MKIFFNRMTAWRPIRVIIESIRNKLLFWFLILSIIPLVALGVTAFYTASTSLNDKTFAQLEALQSSKATTIQNYFTERRGDMAVLVETVKTLRQDAFEKLAAIQKLKINELETFINGMVSDAQFARNLVVVKGTEGVNEGLPTLAQYKNDKTNPAYVEAFKRAEGVLSSYAQENGYADIMMADATGEIVFALNEKSRGSDESKSIEFQKGLEGVYVGDLLYVAVDDETFIRTTIPIKDSKGKTTGVLFLEIEPKRINEIMTERTGLGQTGETYLVGPDKLFRSDSLFVEESTILNQDYVVDTEAVNAALVGQSGQKVILDYRGLPVLSAYAPLKVANINWAVLAEIDVEEAFAPHIAGAEKDFFTQYKETYGYYDLFLFNPNGYLYYTVEKESDYQTNLLTGPYKDSNLGQLVSEILLDTEYKLVDFAPYAPSLDAPAAFIGEPVLNAEGEVETIVALQLPLEAINAVMQERSGLGESGETYLVGQDFKWRSDSRFLDQLGVESTVLSDEFLVNTVASQSALVDQSGTQVINDYRGVPVLSSWSTLVLAAPDENNPQGIKWAVLAEIDQSEVQQPVVTLALITAALVAGAILLVVVVAFLLSGSLTRQIDAIMGLFGNIGIGDFDARTEVVSQDELGTMAESLNAMLDNTLALVQTSEERDSMQSSMMTLLDEISGIAEGDLTREAEVKADITGAIADAFNFTIIQLRDIIGNVQNATVEVSSSANQIQNTAEHLAQDNETQATQIIETSTNAQQGTQAVQDTIEGMNRIRDQVQETAKRIKRLGESSQEVGEIVQLISDIADRTSILALNASIQAAMAGEAGRGFAVVAEEVERLAVRSTDATKQITTLIRTIQSETTEAVAAMETTTHEVVEGSQLADQAGQVLQELSASMGDIAKVTQQTAAGTKETSVAIRSLAVLADNLRGSVSAFKLPSTNGQSS